MAEIICPVCNRTLSPEKPGSRFVRCTDCKLDYPRNLMEDLCSGKLPQYFTLTDEKISVVNFALVPSLLSTAVISLLIILLRHQGFTIMTVSISIIGGMLMFDMFFKSFFRRFSIEKKGDDLIFSNGIGKLKVTQSLPRKQIQKIAIHLRKDRSVNHPVIVIDTKDNKRMLFGDGCPAFYIAAFFFWLNGKNLAIRQEEQSK